MYGRGCFWLVSHRTLIPLKVISYNFSEGEESFAAATAGQDR